MDRERQLGLPGMLEKVIFVIFYALDYGAKRLSSKKTHGAFVIEKSASPSLLPSTPCFHIKSKVLINYSSTVDTSFIRSIENQSMNHYGRLFA